MSVALDLVVRLDGPRPAPALLAALIEAVDALPACSHRWGRLTVHRGCPVVLDRSVRPGELAAADVRAALAGVDGDDVRVAVSTTLAGQRFPGVMDDSPAVLPLRLTCWGTAVGPGPEPEVGQARLTFDPVWPFRTPGGTVGTRLATDVAGNNHRLLELLAAVVEAVDPVSVRGHSDDGPPIPVNAHLVYYRDAAAVERDLAWIERLWWQGSPPRQLGPLAEPPGSAAASPAGVRDWRLHEWRPARQAAAVWEDLGRLVAVLPRIGPAQIADVLVAGSCPVVRCGQGFVVTGGPIPVDGFVDRFYSELADLADTSEGAQTAGR
jgi:hypothetical protein